MEKIKIATVGMIIANFFYQTLQVIPDFYVAIERSFFQLTLGLWIAFLLKNDLKG